MCIKLRNQFCSALSVQLWTRMRKDANVISWTWTVYLGQPSLSADLHNTELSQRYSNLATI